MIQKGTFENQDEQIPLCRKCSVPLDGSNVDCRHNGKDGICISHCGCLICSKCKSDLTHEPRFEYDNNTYCYECAEIRIKNGKKELHFKENENEVDMK